MSDDLPQSGGSYIRSDTGLVQVEGPMVGYPPDDPDPAPVSDGLPDEGGVFEAQPDGSLVQVEGPDMEPTPSPDPAPEEAPQ